MGTILFPEPRNYPSLIVFLQIWHFEQSMNKDTKTKGGIIAYTQDYDDVEKWNLTPTYEQLFTATSRNLFLFHNQMKKKSLHEVPLMKVKWL